jgi:hypothetical protein
MVTDCEWLGLQRDPPMCVSTDLIYGSLWICKLKFYDLLAAYSLGRIWNFDPRFHATEGLS